MMASIHIKVAYRKDILKTLHALKMRLATGKPLKDKRISMLSRMTPLESIDDIPRHVNPQPLTRCLGRRSEQR
jgi:hypothetical protein